MRVVAFALLLAVSPLSALADDEALPETAPVKRLSPADLRTDTLDRLFARLRLAEKAEDAQRSEQAIWKLWMQTGSPSDELLMGQVVKAMTAREYTAATGILDSLIDVHPGFVEAWNKRATIHFLEGRYAQSVDDIEKVLELEPRHFGALAGLGMIRRAEGKRQEALRAFKDALAINPFMPGPRQAIEELDGKETPI